MIRFVALASGAVALVYEVVWTREVALVVGSDVYGTAVVLAAFFGGLAAGARLLGALADRTAKPLRLYAALEAAAGLLALAALWLLRELGANWAALPAPLLRLLAAGVLVPAALPLGGTLPALLRASAGRASEAARSAGILVGLNTAGAVAGVAAAALAIPRLGLARTAAAATALSLVLAGWAALRARPRPDRAASTAEAEIDLAASWPALAAAAVAGAVTLAFEVVAFRMAATQLGSSLLAWAAVLALFLVGLALGNVAAGPRASAARDPLRALGWIESLAALGTAAGLWFLAPAPTVHGEPDAARLAAVALALLPPAILMGAAFPFFVRLCVRDPRRLGAAFGAVTAANTAGGVAGSLLAPFVILPLLGPVVGALACAGTSLLLGVGFLAASHGPPRGRVLRVIAALAGVALAALVGTSREHPTGRSRVIFVAHGPQVSLAVTRTPERRDLVIDGNLEASTFGAARATEELLAWLPILLHPSPRTMLEVGMGSGITLGAASAYPFERVDCVEIAQAVLRAAPFFAPDNRDPTSGRHPGLRITRADGRAFLAAHPSSYDIVVGNTRHPWSVGATGLYSREYFARLASSLRPGGLAAQWIPIQRIGAENLAAILRTFFDAFPEGALWWGDGNVIAVGSTTPLPRVDGRRLTELPPAGQRALARLAIHDARELEARRLGNAEGVREALAPGEVLVDDRPRLEAQRPDGSARGIAEFELLEAISRGAAERDPAAGPMHLWLQSQVARARGDAARADRWEALARDGGLALARRARAQRLVAQGGRLATIPERGEEARTLFEDAREQEVEVPDARYGLAAIALEQGRLDAARIELEGLVARHPEHALGWNLLGIVRRRQGDDAAARSAFDSALTADPFLPAALANAGLLAVDEARPERARSLLARLRAMELTGPFPESGALARALAGGSSPRR